MLNKSLAELEDMSEDELHVWADYLEEEPQGAIRGDMHAALIAMTTAATVSTKPVKFSDFLLFNRKNKQEQTAHAASINIKEVFGGRVYKRKKRRKKHSAEQQATQA